MKTRLKDILKTSLLKDTAKMSVSNLIMYMLPLIVTPILTRLYTPSDFGEWGIFSSFIVMSTIVLFLGFENILIQAPKYQLGNAIKLCIGVSMITILLFGLLFITGNITGNNFISTFPGSILLFIYFVFYTVYTICYNLCNRKELYYTLAFSNIVLGCSQAAFRILLAFIGIQIANGLILGTTLAEGITAIFLLWTITKGSAIKHRAKTSFVQLKQLISQYRNFPLFDAPSSLLSFAAFNLPVIILSFYFDKASIGCFSIVFQLLLLPMSLVGSAIGQVYYQRISISVPNDNIISETTHAVLRILCVISILPLLFIACGGDQLIILFLGNQWHSAGNVALCLALWSFPTILTQPILPLFRILNKQRTLLIYDSMYFLLGIGGIILLCQHTKNLFFILFVYSVSCFVVKMALFLKQLSLSHLNLHQYIKFLPVWGISIALLIIRLIA